MNTIWKTKKKLETFEKHQIFCCFAVCWHTLNLNANLNANVMIDPNGVLITWKNNELQTSTFIHWSNDVGLALEYVKYAQCVQETIFSSVSHKETPYNESRTMDGVHACINISQNRAFYAPEMSNQKKIIFGTQNVDMQTILPLFTMCMRKSKMKFVRWIRNEKPV